MLDGINPKQKRDNTRVILDGLLTRHREAEYGKLRNRLISRSVQGVECIEECQSTLAMGILNTVRYKNLISKQVITFLVLLDLSTRI